VDPLLNYGLWPDIWKDKGREALWNSNAEDEHHLYIYIYIYMCVCVHVYIYICIFIGMWAFVAFSIRVVELRILHFAVLHTVIIILDFNFLLLTVQSVK
jgi:hypothetical protein